MKSFNKQPPSVTVILSFSPMTPSLLLKLLSSFTACIFMLIWVSKAYYIIILDKFPNPWMAKMNKTTRGLKSTYPKKTEPNVCGCACSRVKIHTSTGGTHVRQGYNLSHTCVNKHTHRKPGRFPQRAAHSHGLARLPFMIF